MPARKPSASESVIPCSLLLQVGLLDPAGWPVVGGAAAGLSQIDGAALLAPVRVGLAAVAARDRAGGPADQQLLQLRLAVQFPQAAAPGAARGCGGLIRALAKDPDEVVPADAGGQQPDAASDVETDPARRDHTATGDTGGGGPADRQPVTPVHIEHRIRHSDDAGQFRDVGHLLQRAVRGQVGDQRARGAHHAGHLHPTLPRDDQPVPRFRDNLHRAPPARTKAPRARFRRAPALRRPGLLAGGQRDVLYDSPGRG